MKGKSSEVGANAPTEQTQQTMDNMVDNILGASLSSAEETSKPDVTEEEVKEKSLDSQDEEAVEEQPEEAEDSEQSEETEGLEEEADDDEVVPKSKHKKALESMQKRIDEMTKKIKEYESKEQKEPVTQEERLQSLTPQELEELSDSVDDSIIDAKIQARDGVDTTEKIKELKQLKQNIKKTIRQAPLTFQKKQLEILNEVSQELSEIDPDVVNQKGQLWETAVRIYKASPSLQRTVTGQGEAMRLAGEYLLQMKHFSQGKEKVSELSRRVNSLKKKTSLDTSIRKGNESKVNINKLREKARNGTYDDKLAFVKNALVVDDFIQ